MNFMGSHPLLLAGLTTATAVAYFAFSSRNAEKIVSRGGNPQIGDTVALKINGMEKTYHVIGASGHSLATCTLISTNCINKTHQGQSLYFVTEEKELHTAEAYARQNSEPVYREPGTDPALLGEDEIPAIAYLGVNWRIQSLFPGSIGSFSSTVLNFSFLDVQVVHIKTLDKN